MNGRIGLLVAVALARGFAFGTGIEAKAPQPVPEQWQGLKVGVLGDSITEPTQQQPTYWRYLADWLDWDVRVYGVSGHSWSHISGQTDRLAAEMSNEVDAVIIFVGTNDYAGGRPLGKWYDESEGLVNWWGEERKLIRRSFNKDRDTVRGSINIALEKLKVRYPRSQIVLLTPTKRWFFKWSDTNVQPAEDWPNTIGLHIEDYVQCVREAGQIWSCPVIDLYGESGLLPCTDGYSRYFRNEKTDGLHPNGLGHERLARLIYHRLSALPGTFRDCVGK